MTVHLKRAARSVQLKTGRRCSGWYKICYKPFFAEKHKKKHSLFQPPPGSPKKTARTADRSVSGVTIYSKRQHPDSLLGNKRKMYHLVLVNSHTESLSHTMIYIEHYNPTDFASTAQFEIPSLNAWYQKYTQSITLPRRRVAAAQNATHFIPPPAFRMPTTSRVHTSIHKS